MRIGVQSMVNLMNRLLGCPLATRLQGKNAEASKTTHTVLSQQFPTQLAGFHQARWLIVSDYACMESDRWVACAKMSIEKSALREFNSKAMDLPHKDSDCLMSAP